MFTWVVRGLLLEEYLELIFNLIRSNFQFDRSLDYKSNNVALGCSNLGPGYRVTDDANWPSAVSEEGNMNDKACRYGHYPGGGLSRGKYCDNFHIYCRRVE